MNEEPAEYRFPRNEMDRGNVRRSRERHVYVVEFASGMVKVGQAMIVKDRLRTLARSAEVHSDRITRAWNSDVHAGFDDNEQALIAFCTARWTPAASVEYFRDADFDSVVEYAQGLSYARLTDDEVAAIQENAALKVDFFRRDRDEKLQLADMAHAIEIARTQVNLVVSLANDHNREAVQEALFEIYKELCFKTPSPWSEIDPMASQRHLMACGVATEQAQRNAPDFEAGMRALYSMTYLREPASFEDLARFCAPYMPGVAR